MTHEIKNKDTRENELGMDADITRRDFINSALIGSGAALLSMAAPGCKPDTQEKTAQPSEPAATKTLLTDLGSDWTGPGGIGDYSESNGNTAEVVNAAHAVRDGLLKNLPEDVIDTGEIYDVIAVGGGFAGLSTAYTIQSEYKGEKSCLVLDNHPIFGGEAKQNEFEVDGYHLHAPQGSNGFLWPLSTAKKVGVFHRYWHEVGLPADGLSWQTTATGTEKPLNFPPDHFVSMSGNPDDITTGFFYRNKETEEKQWVLGARENGFADAPISEQLRNDLQELYGVEPLNIKFPENWREWLDSMSLKDFVTKEMGLTAETCDYIKGVISTSGGGLSPDVISAYSATQYFSPPVRRIWATLATQGLIEFPGIGESVEDSEEEFGTLSSFPGGNAGIARHFVKKMIPNSIEGGSSLNDVLNNPVNWHALDREDQSVRIRCRSMVVYVAHEGTPEKSEYVNVVYTNTQTGKAYRVKAKAVVMASGGWINKHIVRDLPDRFKQAYQQFYHAPILTANVAVRNWRFMEKLGISGAHWFDGFGWFVNLRAPMKLGKATMPLDPDKPAVLTFYVPFLKEGIPLQAQAVLSRTELFSTSYKDFEIQIRQQLTDMFGDYGFDAKRDIAGIITNRWGHAYIVPQPGYYYGEGGNKAPREIIREGYGRISFGHSELTGEQLWSTAVAEGEKATRQLMKWL